jgi:DNA-directed RNA polymerase subunit M/transcription elongation factor TFIIS
MLTIPFNMPPSIATPQIKNPEQFRANIRQYFHKIIQGDIKQSSNLEKAVYNYVIKEATQRKIIKKWENPFFKQLYTDRLRTVFNNIKSPQILTAIQSGELNPQTFAFMTHQEMNPERWAPLIIKKTKRDASKFNNNIEASTDMYTCKKCRSKKCTYYELQTRSADEPATIFVTCLDCGKHWRG